MKLNKAQLATKLRCSERALSLWQQEGLPVLEHGRRGRPNFYDLGTVIAWLKRTARGITPRPGHRAIDIEALERELGSDSSARVVAEDLHQYLCEHLGIALAARLHNTRGMDPELGIGIVCDLFDTLWTILVDRFGVEFGSERGDELLACFYDDEDSGRRGLVERIYQAAALERAKFPPELEFDPAFEPSGRPPPGPAGEASSNG